MCPLQSLNRELFKLGLQTGKVHQSCRSGQRGLQDAWKAVTSYAVPFWVESKQVIAKKDLHRSLSVVKCLGTACMHCEPSAFPGHLFLGGFGFWEIMWSGDDVSSWPGSEDAPWIPCSQEGCAGLCLGWGRDARHESAELP